MLTDAVQRDMWLRCWLAFVLLFSNVAYGHLVPQYTVEQPAAWYRGEAWTSEHSLTSYLQSLSPQKSFELTGGEQISVVKFHVLTAGDFVIDFRNSALIGEYKHLLFDQFDSLVTVRQGGIWRDDVSDYFLRNGQNIYLRHGHYTLITYQQSQFNIAPPTPFVIDKHHYIEQVKVGNTITLVGLGILIALFFYYLVLSLARSNLVDLMYALFILGNLIFNATSLLAASHLLGSRWFGGASWPILFSNIAYIVFVLALLKVSNQRNPILWKVGCLIISLFSLFIVLSFWLPHYQNEFNRFSVGIFLAFGILVGIRRSLQGNVIARLYLLANLGFVVLGAIAISQEEIQGFQTIYMSHIGLLAVACEVLLLSFVIAYQMVLLEADKTRALKQAQEMLTIAQTDPLTRLPNRYAMEKHLLTVGRECSFIYIDLDGLKSCNDRYGHDMGDRLLIEFSKKLTLNLPHSSRLYRISGDEFGIIFSSNLTEEVEAAIESVEADLKRQFTAKVGVSFGRAQFAEHAHYQKVIQAADENMYSNKKRKQSVTEL